MDVRCEKCQTEYELDESKLKPGGVTVKCTTCGHMFKVRPEARPAPRAPTPEEVGAATVRTDRITPKERASSVLMDAEDGERTWLIRLEDGEIKTCRELSTLQKWIVSGRVSRSCSISRTGKKWKLLGEIGELASFFSIADEAREARNSGRWAAGSREAATREYPVQPDPDGSLPASASTSHPRTVPRRSSADPSAPLHLDDDSRGRVGNGADPASEARLGDDEERTVPVSAKSYADALAAEMKMGAAPAGSTPGFARTLPLGGAGVAQPGRAAGGNDAGRKGPPAAHDLPVDEAEPAPPASLGNATTLPPYGSGVPAGNSGSARAASLPLAPPPSRPAPSVQPASRPVPPVASAPSGPSTAGWAVQGQVADVRDRDHGPSGPTGGMARGHAPEAAFVGGSRAPRMRGEPEDGRFARPYPDEDPLLRRRSRSGLWVGVLSLLVMAGSAGAVYLFMFAGRDDEPDETAQPAVTAPRDAAAATASAVPPPTTPPVTAPETPPRPEPAAPDEKLLADVNAAIFGDSQAALEPLAKELSSARAAEAGASVLVARSRVEAALAQQLFDRSKLAASSSERRKLASQSRARARTARQLADEALKAEPDNPGALIALADARRLAGDRTVEVERWIRRARQYPAAAKLEGEADLVLALLRIRDEHLGDARVLLDRLTKGAAAADVRPRYRLSWVDYLDRNPDAAKEGAEAVLKAQPDHAGARALLDKIAAAGEAPVETGDPMPPEDKGGKPGEKPGDKVAGGQPGDKGTGAGAGKPVEGSGDSFDVILDRAGKLAENGNCAAAMPLFRKVLDMHPASVEALTGLGDCHLERREFASAHARFRAALGISSRYQPAMWGIAEAYQQQGLKQQALERFQAFVAEHPTHARAAAARARIDALKRELGQAGGQGSAGGDSQGSGSGEEDQGGDSGDEPSGGDDAKSDGKTSSETPAGA
jgi:predicted Zn finger-like uncharacterized protein